MNHFSDHIPALWQTSWREQQDYQLLNPTIFPLNSIS